MDYCSGGEFFRMLKSQPERRIPEDWVRFYAAEVLLALGSHPCSEFNLCVYHDVSLLSCSLKQVAWKSCVVVRLCQIY